MIRALALIGGLLLAASLAHAAPAVDAVDHIVIPVSRLDRAVACYTGALSFVAGEPEASSRLVLHLGKEKIELMQRAGRPIPADSCSNDLWFQHLAIVVSDIDEAYAAVQRAGAMPISRRPQLLPAWNPNAGGIRAVYFRDPDGHPLELIQFPPDKGERRWQEKDRLFLGIDHSAIAVSDTDQSSLSIGTGSACGSPARAITGVSNRKACRRCQAPMSASPRCAPAAARGSSCCTI